MIQNENENENEREMVMEDLSEDEKKALRGSKFAPLPPPPSSLPQQPRLAHPGGPLTTNKGAALAKFLERKLQDPNGLASINPDLIELAVKNAKDSIKASGGSSDSGRLIKHVDSFDDAAVSSEEENYEAAKKRKKNKDRKRNKKNKQEKKMKKKELKMEVVESTQLKKPKKKKLKL